MLTKLSSIKLCETLKVCPRGDVKLKPSDKFLFTLALDEDIKEQTIDIYGTAEKAAIIHINASHGRKIVDVIAGNAGIAYLEKDDFNCFAISSDYAPSIQTQKASPSLKIDNLDIIWADETSYFYSATYGLEEKYFLVSGTWTQGDQWSLKYRDAFPGEWFYPDISSVSYAAQDGFIAFAAGILEKEDSDNLCIALSIIDKSGVVRESSRLLLDELFFSAHHPFFGLKYGQAIICRGDILLFLSLSSLDGQHMSTIAYQVKSTSFTEISSLSPTRLDGMGIFGVTCHGNIIAIGKGSDEIDIIEYSLQSGV